MSEAKTVMVRVRMHPSEHANLQLLAKASRRSMSDVIRLLIADEVTNIIDRGKKPR